MARCFAGWRALPKRWFGLSRTSSALRRNYELKAGLRTGRCDSVDLSCGLLRASVPRVPRRENRRTFSCRVGLRERVGFLWGQEWLWQVRRRWVRPFLNRTRRPSCLSRPRFFLPCGRFLKPRRARSDSFAHRPVLGSTRQRTQEPLAHSCSSFSYCGGSTSRSS